MVLGIINEMRQDCRNQHTQDQRICLTESMLIGIQQHHVQNMHARPHLDKLNDIIYT